MTCCRRPGADKSRLENANGAAATQCNGNIGEQTQWRRRRSPLKHRMSTARDEGNAWRCGKIHAAHYTVTVYCSRGFGVLQTRYNSLHVHVGRLAGQVRGCRGLERGFLSPLCTFPLPSFAATLAGGHGSACLDPRPRPVPLCRSNTEGPPFLTIRCLNHLPVLRQSPPGRHSFTAAPTTPRLRSSHPDQRSDPALRAASHSPPGHGPLTHPSRLPCQRSSSAASLPTTLS